MEETNSHLYQELLDAVLKMKDADGRMICELFLKLPPRQVSPSKISKLYNYNILGRFFMALRLRDFTCIFHSCCNIRKKYHKYLSDLLLNYMYM